MLFVAQVLTAAVSKPHEICDFELIASRLTSLPRAKVLKSTPMRSPDDKWTGSLGMVPQAGLSTGADGSSTATFFSPECSSL
eukprot:4777648-Amphidinium_carterae.2